MKFFAAFTKESVPTTIGTSINYVQLSLIRIDAEYRAVENPNPKLVGKVYDIKEVELIATGNQDILKTVVVQDCGEFKA